ncbi:hypothetical protein SDC9_209356 [bioreactor metagenome]|uniref:Uncharacterized protein n=1 Tax=bioreactor metagenome TaxID=1076179 RepID=A0A645JD44_9ZZZZ
MLDWARRNKRTELYIVTYKLSADALKTAIANGEEIPGVVQLPAGERINITVNAEAIDAVKRAAEEA